MFLVEPIGLNNSRIMDPWNIGIFQKININQPDNKKNQKEQARYHNGYISIVDPFVT